MFAVHGYCMSRSAHGVRGPHVAALMLCGQVRYVRPLAFRNRRQPLLELPAGSVLGDDALRDFVLAPKTSGAFEWRRNTFYKLIRYHTIRLASGQASSALETQPPFALQAA